MKKYVATSTTYLPFLSKAVGYVPSLNAQCIVCTDETGRPLAGAIYDYYNGQIIQSHVWVDPEHRPSKEWYFAACDYPFRQLKVKKVIAQIRSDNEEALSHAEHIGYQIEARISDYFEDGVDMLVLTMTEEQCVICSSPKWAKVRERVLGILGV